MGQAPYLDLGPCDVIFNGSSLGATFGGVILRSEAIAQGIKEDAQGETDVDRVFTGRNVSVEVPLTRVGFATLQKVIANSAGGVTNVVVSNPVGLAEYDNAKAMILKPVIDGVVSVTESQWLYLYKVHAEENSELSWDNSKQRVFKVIFKVFPYTGSGLTGALYRFGPAT
jgi:hypothetical protein